MAALVVTSVLGIVGVVFMVYFMVGVQRDLNAAKRAKAVGEVWPSRRSWI